MNSEEIDREWKEGIETDPEEVRRKLAFDYEAKPREGDVYNLPGRLRIYVDFIKNDTVYFRKFFSGKFNGCIQASMKDFTEALEAKRIPALSAHDCANCETNCDGYCQKIKQTLGTRSGEPYPTIQGVGDEYCGAPAEAARMEAARKRLRGVTYGIGVTAAESAAGFARAADACNDIVAALNKFGNTESLGGE